MNEKQLEEALNDWPLTEVPTGFSKSVMEQIKYRQPVVQAPPKISLRFRLTWVDYILGIFLCLLPVLGFIAFTLLPRKFILYVSYQWLLLRSPAYEPVLFAFMGVAGMLVILAFLLGLRYIFPRQMSLF
jgi:hypothetical protein